MNTLMQSFSALFLVLSVFFTFSPLPTAEALRLRKLRQRHHSLGLKPDSVSEIDRGEFKLSFVLQLHLGLAESVLRCPFEMRR
jgi:hypothetical protein